jgi:FkbH-like protein
VVQQTFLDTSVPLFGSFDRLVPATPSRLIARLNDLVAEAATQEQVLLLDVASASARDGIDAWFDTARWLQGKMEIAPHAAPRFGELLLRVIDAQRGRSKRCLVLDLDNTLWGGVVGDDGIDGIVLGQGSARGEAHIALQRYAKRLAERGVILAVCSKNDPAIAETAFRDHPEMVLQRSDIAAFVANWNDKAENLRVIANHLNIGLDSLVFVDDNPVERARVREALPMVAVPELPADPAAYVRFLAQAGHFEAVSFTDDDRARAGQYAANTEREQLRNTSISLDDFLRSLQMVVSFGAIARIDLARAAQLVNKTNQFNTTGRRCTAEEIAALAADPAAITLQFRLADRFGDNGLVSVLLMRPAPDERAALEIDAWVMSCRVFGRQLEDEAMNIAVECARARGAMALLARFVPTAKNGVIRDLFPRLGFDLEPGSDAATSRWRLPLERYTPRPTFIIRKAAS